MKRIMMLVTAALVMAAMMVAVSMPAFAGGGGTPDPCTSAFPNYGCSGGGGGGGGGAPSEPTGGGYGIHYEANLESGEYTSSGGGGGGGPGLDGGGGGEHCTGNIYGEIQCVGGGS